MTDLIWCDFSRKVHFKYLKAKYGTYWSLFSEFFILGPCIVNQMSCDFFPRFVLSILKVKYWIYWTVFNKYHIPKSYLMDPVSRDFFSKFHFKYLEAKWSILLMEDLWSGSFFKLVLMFLKWFECFLKRLRFSRFWIFTFYSIFMKALHSKWTSAKTFQLRIHIEEGHRPL